MAKNRLHLDLDISGGRDGPLDLRRARTDSKAASPQRLSELGGEFTAAKEAALAELKMDA
ncbi:MAG: hypothetical protein LH645_12065 [Actinomycetia bacterium]|nr:hypothetical protein [Actinomycetes bacterium]